MTYNGGEGLPKKKLQKNAQKKKSSKKAKIIVRNLPFKNFNEKSLKDLFSSYGEIEEVKLLRKPDNKLVGCGFVEFKSKFSAAKAINSANQKEVNGRKIIIDWALPKDTFIKKVKQFKEENNVKTENVSDSEDDGENVKICIDKKPSTWASESESESDREQDDDDDGDDGNNSLVDESVDSHDDCDDDDDDDDISDDSTHEKKLNRKKLIKKENKINEAKKLNRLSDAEDGKTVFIRNVPFTATNNDLKESVEVYGPVEYALICIDKLTEHSKGTAFVKFKSEESASQCVKDSNKLCIQDTPVNVAYALTKEHLENKKTNKKVTKDSRNLYLVREGVVPAGSKAANGVSASDMSKRLQLEQWKSQILKNLNMFVSKNRLVVHNLPPHYDDQKLRRLFLTHGNPKAIIKEAKVMWEKNKLNAKGKHISKEVGFVSFADHEDALTALRNINNNPNIFTPNKRPIVAFSIENRAVINQKQKRIEKSRAKLGVNIDSKMSKLNRKQRRFIRRRQKFIEQRREAKKLNEKHRGDSTEAKPVGVQKRKMNEDETKGEENSKGGKKRRIQVSKGESEGEAEFKPFTGVTSEPGKKVKLRSRFNLKKQALLHSQTLKKEKAKRKMKKTRKSLEPMKQPKQKKGKKKLLDDAKLSKLISKHRESIQQSSAVKKWYET